MTQSTITTQGPKELCRDRENLCCDLSHPACLGTLSHHRKTVLQHRARRLCRMRWTAVVSACRCTHLGRVVRSSWDPVATQETLLRHMAGETLSRHNFSVVIEDPKWAVALPGPPTPPVPFFFSFLKHPKFSIN